METFELAAEYYKIVDIINSFDERLLQIKGWGVTFGLATIAIGFKEKVRGVFMLAAIAGICFWMIEAETKWHQSNYYLRMNEIEYFCSQNTGLSENCPKIDWSWSKSKAISTPFSKEIDDSKIMKKVSSNRYIWYVMPHVIIPHIVVVFLGFFFFRRKQFDKWVNNTTC